MSVLNILVNFATKNQSRSSHHVSTTCHFPDGIGITPDGHMFFCMRYIFFDLVCIHNDLDQPSGHLTWLLKMLIEIVSLPIQNGGFP